MYDTQEKQLIMDILDGRAEGYAVLVNRYQRPVFNMLLRMVGCREDAADLLQETFMKAYENLERFRLSSRFFPWLYTIGMNLARDHLRKKKTAGNAAVYMRQDAADPAASGSHNPQHLDQLVDAGRMPALLAKLPVDYREALILRYHQGLAARDIGAALGVTTSGAKMRIKRGLEKLRGMLKLDNHEKIEDCID